MAGFERQREMAGRRDRPAESTIAGPDGLLSFFGVVEGRAFSATVRLGEILAATDFRQPPPMRGPDRFTKCWMRTPEAFRREFPRRAVGHVNTRKHGASVPQSFYRFAANGTENWSR
jgi:hypothetical protein